MKRAQEEAEFPRGGAVGLTPLEELELEDEVRKDLINAEPVQKKVKTTTAQIKRLHFGALSVGSKSFL